MESRKRTRTEDADSIPAKKRALTDGRDSPRTPSGTPSATDEPKDGDNLEMFRKEAIFRRMKHYSRENERSQARINELERRRNTCEAGLAALEACWTQLIATIRSTVKSDELPPVDVGERDIYDMTKHVASDPDPEYVDGLRDKMRATEQLVVAFIQLGGKAEAKLLKDEMYKRCQQAQTQCSALRSEVSLLNAKLQDVESEKEQYHEQLVTAEKRLDRLNVAVAKQSDLEEVKIEMKGESPKDSPSPPSPPQYVNGAYSGDSEEWKAVVQLKDEKIEELSRQNSELRDEVLNLKLQLKAPSEELITATHYYNVLLQHASKLEHTLSESNVEATRLRTELDQLKSSRQEWQESVTVSNEKTVYELQNMLVKRDNENARLREQRDQHQSELNERKQKESMKLQSVQEYKALAETRSDRIHVLESEVTRLKTRLVAEASDTDLMAFLFKYSANDVSYIGDLKQRLGDAEARIAAMNGSSSEAEARQQLASVTKQLEEYKRVFGETSSSSDPQALSTQLRKKEEEIQKLQVLERQRDQAESSLYTELEKLSAAWEALDKQVKNKVYDLTAMEERVNKAGLEKAKSDNKFYSAMRDKEAVENERKNLARNLEKQAKVIEKLSEAEKSLLLRQSDLEKEITTMRKYVEGAKHRIGALEADVQQWTSRANGERKRFEDARVILSEADKSLEKQRVELRKQEEALTRSKKDVEKQASKAKAISHHNNSSSSVREAELQTEVDKCMSILKCSTCRMNMRNTVITKCMHSFCKNCVNERISSRQRKCPACNLPFSQGEVQQLYFQ